MLSMCALEICHKLMAGTYGSVRNSVQANYDASDECFIINTPTNTASKFWIGGAGTDATVSHPCSA